MLLALVSCFMPCDPVCSCLYSLRPVALVMHSDTDEVGPRQVVTDLVSLGWQTLPGRVVTSRVQTSRTSQGEQR